MELTEIRTQLSLLLASNPKNYVEENIQLVKELDEMRYVLELRNNDINDKQNKIKELEDKIIKKHGKY